MIFRESILDTRLGFFLFISKCQHIFCHFFLIFAGHLLYKQLDVFGFICFQKAWHIFFISTISNESKNPWHHVIESYLLNTSSKSSASSVAILTSSAIIWASFSNSLIGAIFFNQSNLIHAFGPSRNSLGKISTLHPLLRRSAELWMLSMYL